MKYILLFIFLTPLLAKAQSANWQYLGQPTPKSELALFKISTMLSERDLGISPDGKEIYYSLTSIGHVLQTIVFVKYENQQWSSPQIASFSGKYKDIEATFSQDGKRLYFSSNRPLNESDNSPDYNIWYVEKQGEGWSEPKNVGEVINTEADEFYPSIAKNGNLYFTAAYKNAKGKEDIYCAKWQNDAYQTPESLSDSINEVGYEFNAFIAPDESFLIFTGYGRKDDMGGGDLYIAIKNTKGEWSKARNLGKNINSSKIDYCPFVSPDGKYLFFTSERLRSNFFQSQNNYQEWVNNVQSPQNGLGDIYWIEMSKILK